jgi:hypothetical protein
VDAVTAADDWPDVAVEGAGLDRKLDDSFSEEVESKRDDDDQPKRSASTLLVEIAQERYRFGVSDTGDTFGVPRSGPKVVHMLRGGKVSLRKQLARIYFTRMHRAAPQQALADALLVVEGMAQEEEPTPLALRVARIGDVSWIDLGDQTGRAIRVAANGWSVEPWSPVLFRRTELTAALPVPEPGASLDELWEWLNVDPDDRALVVAWLICVLFPEMPHPVLNFSGEQGTGKTTAEKVLVLLVDPTPVPCRKAPRDAESWVTSAAGSWVVGLDNLSEIPDWLSDSICRAVTGDGDIRRRLYTDGELAVFAFRRCIVMSGIDVGAVRGDLADRLLPVGLHVIDDERRLEEHELWPEWQKAHPRLLGALLELAAGVAGVLPSVRLARKPRMADYARVLAAVDQVLGTDGLGRYVEKQGSLARESLTDDEFVIAIGSSVGERFTGTSAELLSKVTPSVDGKPPKGWPATARQVTKRLRRQAPVMRKAGWTVTDDEGNNHAKVAQWIIEPPSRPREAGISGTRDPQDPHRAGLAGLAGHEYGPSQDDGHLWPVEEAPDGH